MPEDDKKYSKHLIGKTVVTKSGKKFGEVGNLTFETRTGELMHILLKNPTPYVDALNLEKDKRGNWMIPFGAVVAVGDFIVVSEEEVA
ncbi:MAG: PRC-barrel domain-containing protein [Candidatus Nanoarchaeia archaeon]|nr:PRC-barrel domain-containing protein [Candidatus Nanoarchaeia archaeon]MDI6738394.1 PRC-barrel domain-containing protein [Nanoarchaeota archaeon]